MKLTVIAVADFASVEYITNKLTLVGVFDTWFVPALPAKVSFYTAARFEFVTDQLGEQEHNAAIRIVAPDNTVLVEYGGPLQVLPAEMPTTTIPLVVKFDGFEVATEGTYRFVVLYGGQEVGSTPLYVKKLPQSPQPEEMP